MDVSCDAPAGAFWFAQQAAPLSGRGGGAVLSYSDITVRKQCEDASAHRATHDALTALPNRVLIEDRLMHALAGLEREPGHVAVLFIDVDRFKDVNDTHGHATGDAVLAGVARRLRGCVRPADTVGRMGGDEFVVVCAGDPDARAADDIAERVRQAMLSPFHVGGHVITVDVSIGICLTAQSLDTPQDLFHVADARMFEAKARGGGRAVQSSTPLPDRVPGQLELAARLRRAVAEDALILHYQPVVDLASGDLVGIEALLRWPQPDGACWGASRFIRVAERAGLLAAIDRRVVRQACRDVAAAFRAVPVFVNVSADELDDDFLTVAKEALSDADMSPERLVLDVTERSIAADPVSVERLLRDLRADHARVALDDFGTGSSSLALLSHLPVDLVKVDVSLTGRLGGTIEDDRAVEVIVRLAAVLGLTAVAEGVETEAQRRCLRALGCGQAQGNAIDPPSPLLQLIARYGLH